MTTTLAAPTLTPEELSWDLSDLFDGIDDPRLEQTMHAARERAERFEATYKGKIAAAELDAATLRAALDEYDSILREQYRPASYASLTFSADTSDARHGALLQKMQELGTRVSTHLIFFSLEIGRMPDDTFNALIGDASLDEYRHYLEQERITAKYNLTEPEERVLQEVSNTGNRAFQRLFGEVTSRAKFPYRHGDQTQQLTQSEIMTLLYDPDREVRRASAAGITEGIRAHEHVLTFTYNTLLQHKSTMDRLRDYEYPEQSRHLKNELDPSVVDTVVEVTVANYDVVAEYYDLKRRLLGLDTLTHYDRYAPLQGERATIPYGEARDLVLDSFREFSGRMADLSADFFDRRWIDAALRPGKRGGAFCSYVTPDLHPYVFMNYTGKPRDVMTLAHELGHAVHACVSRGQNLLQFHSSLPMAETASVFGESLVFDRLQTQLESPQDRLSLLCGKIEDTFATVFRQVAMYRFERDAHRLRREKGELTTEDLSEAWQRNMQEMFGDALTLGEEHRYWWMYIPHIINTPFYVYAYAIGELQVLSLYARYKQEGAPFVEKYFRLLETGGSLSPAEQLQIVDIDIHDRAFWEGGAQIIRQQVARAKELASA